jgi:hypothetical protein
MGFAPDAIFGTGFACVNPAPTLPTVGTRAQVKTSCASESYWGASTQWASFVGRTSRRPSTIIRQWPKYADRSITGMMICGNSGVFGPKGVQE